jgi:hypothetical protein
MALYVSYVFVVFSIRRESLDLDLGRWIRHLWGGSVTKDHRDTLRRTCVFASNAICRSHSAFCSVRGAKFWRTIFHARVGLLRTPQKARWDTLRRTYFLHPVGSTGHIVCCGATRMRNIDALFFMLEWAWWESHKKHVGLSYIEHKFLHLVGSADHIACCCATGAWNVDTIFDARMGSLWILKKVRQDTLRWTCFFASGRICVSWGALSCI